MEGMTEELEAVLSVFSEELSVSEGQDGSKRVEYRVGSQEVLTVHLDSKYSN